jgi:CheY-like chemotaxis protein
MDGLQATRVLRTLPGWQRTPILAMTANAYEHDRQACLAAGMDDFVSKPVEPQALYGKLLHWLGRQRQAGAPGTLGITAFGGADAEADVATTGQAGLQPMLHELRQLLLHSDTSALDLAALHETPLRGLLGERWPHFERALQHYDFDQARTLLEAGEPASGPTN